MPKQERLRTRSNESQGGTEGWVGDVLILAACLWLPSPLMSERCLFTPSQAASHSGLIRCLLIALIGRLPWAEWRVCVLFLSTGAQSGESCRDGPVKHWADQRHLTSSYRSMGVMFGYRPASTAATGSQITRPFCTARAWMHSTSH